MKPRPRRYRITAYWAWASWNNADRVYFDTNCWRILGIKVPMGLPWDVRFAVNDRMCRWLEPR